MFLPARVPAPDCFKHLLLDKRGRCLLPLANPRPEPVDAKNKRLCLVAGIGEIVIADPVKDLLFDVPRVGLYERRHVFCKRGVEGVVWQDRYRVPKDRLKHLFSQIIGEGKAPAVYFAAIYPEDDWKDSHLATLFQLVDYLHMGLGHGIEMGKVDCGGQLGSLICWLISIIYQPE